MRKNETQCSVCDQMVGVAVSWNRRLPGQAPDWKVARHRRYNSGNRALPSRGRGVIPICPGSGFVVPFAVVMDAAVSA